MKNIDRASRRIPPTISCTSILFHNLIPFVFKIISCVSETWAEHLVEIDRSSPAYRSLCRRPHLVSSPPALPAISRLRSAVPESQLVWAWTPNYSQVLKRTYQYSEVPKGTLKYPEVLKSTHRYSNVLGGLHRCPPQQV